jgi:hypothetical protein
MNDYDRENLQFLLNVDKETLKDWYDEMEEDDHEYASELLAAYSEELNVKSALIQDPKIEVVSEATDFLKRFSLGKK